MAKKSSYKFKKPNFNLIKRSNENFMTLYNDALYYAHYELPYAKLRKETYTYLRNNDVDVDGLSSLEDHRFSVVGKVCFVLNNGGDLPESIECTFSKHLDEMFEIAKRHDANTTETDDDDKKTRKVINIQERMKQQAAVVAAVFDGWVDEFTESPSTFDVASKNPSTVLVDNEMKQGHCRFIKGFYEQDATEIKAALDGTDKDAKEAYSHYNKIQLRRLLKLYDSIFDACELVIERAKANKKPRAKRAVNKDRVVKNLKYMKEDTSLNIVSINPVSIIGAKELWIYNTKTRKLGVYKAFDNAGLSVKGTSILNFSKDKSVEKTLRKPEVQLPEMKKGNKRYKVNFFNDIKSVEKPLNGRINDNCVLLLVG